MKKNKFLSVIILINFLIITFITSYSNVYANFKQSEISEQESQIIREEKVFYSATEKKIENYSKEQLPEINTKSEKLLDAFNKEISNIDNISKIYDSSLDREATRIVTDNIVVDIDENGDIVSYKNLDDYSIVDKDKRDYVEGEKLLKTNYMLKEKSDLNSVISSIEEINNLETYKLVDCNNDIEECWILSWCKNYDNNLINPYDTINVIIDAKDGSIMLYGKNENEPNSVEPAISAENAISYASNTISKYKGYNDIDAELTFYKLETNNTEDDIRLTWNISIDENIFIYVDAKTGEILGEDRTKSDYARSMSTCNFLGYVECANMASQAFTRLGYNQTGYPVVTWSISQTDIDWVLSRPNLYGLYLNCHGGYHGSYSTLTDNSNWIIYSTTNYGNWHFVYVDACYSSVNNNWAKSFGATSAGRCFVGWNVSVYETTAYDFDKRFFPRLGYMSVYDNVITSLWESRNAGYNNPNGNICNPGFAGDSNYYGWAW